MKIITLANSKGGVGKTTLTLNLINVLSQLGKKILVFDTDPQANLSRSLLPFFNNQTNIENWFKSNTDNKLLENTIKKTSLKNIDIVEAYNKLISDTNHQLYLSSMGELLLYNNFKKNFNFLKENYDYIFFDTSPSFNKILLSVLLVSDEIITVIEPHKYSYEGILTIKEPYDNAIKSLNELGLKFENNMKYYLLNKVGKNKTHEAVIDFLNSGAFKDKILKTKIPLSTVKQKETMLMKFNSITLKNPIAILVKELIEKGVL